MDGVGQPITASMDLLGEQPSNSLEEFADLEVSVLASQKTIDVISYVTVTPTNSSPNDAERGGEMSRSDKIALGVGIGIGLPATIAGIAVCCLQMLRG